MLLPMRSLMRSRGFRPVNSQQDGVMQLENGVYGAELEFDDGYTDFAEVGSKETADFYATLQMGDLDYAGHLALSKIAAFNTLARQEMRTAATMLKAAVVASVWLFLPRGEEEITPC